jgi:phage shock protein PspC (stress-responsive transcriptional regulator)
MLERNTNKAWVAGIASGLSETYNLNVWLVRAMFVATFFFFGLGLLAYWMFWSSIPGHDNQIRMNFTS